jgi:aquaporin Z
LLQQLTAEVIGTFVLVFFGCGSIVYAGQIRAVGKLTTITTIGLAFGIAVMVMAYAFGRVSGAHLNPAVSLAAAAGGRMPWVRAGLYAAAQVAGAVLGALALFVLLHGYPGFDATGNMGQNSFGSQGSGYAAWAAFLLEALMTAVFATVVLAVTDERNEHPALAPLAIGLTLTAIHFVTIPATGTSVNPARSIGPGLFAGTAAVEQLWLFILAPLVGGAVAGLAYPLVFGRAGDAVAGSGIRLPRRGMVVVGPDQYQQQWNQDANAGSWLFAGQGHGQGQPPAEEAPVVQDGWQWDPVGQQWHPVGSTPEQWRAHQAAQREAEREAERRRAAGPDDPREPDDPAS